MNAMMTYGSKLATELSASELRDVCKEIGGLQVPHPDAPFDDYLAWFAASMFISCRADIEDAAKAGATAASLLLSCPTYALALVPHVERALGRKVTAADAPLRS